MKFEIEYYYKAQQKEKARTGENTGSGREKIEEGGMQRRNL
jgi:hypothetical protein